MSRNKYPEETVNLILDIAYKLFLEKGYDNTTIQDIIDNMGGLTKGALYHHFKSKEDILVGVSNRIFAENIDSEKYDKLLSSALSAKEKFAGYINLIINDRAENSLRLIYPDLKKTPQFLVTVLENTINGALTKNLTLIFNQAIKEKTIQTEYPEQLAEAMAMLINIWINPYIWEISDEKLMCKICFLNELFQKYGATSFIETSHPIIKNLMLMNKKK